ncbi:MAG: 14-3-3 family protein [archaeon]|nr:14-3-3 family protein [archaeon]
MESNSIRNKTYTREEYVYLAKLYERAERFEDMVYFINKYVELDASLSHEERNILSAGYKNIISAKRASWRLLNSLERKEEKKSSPQIEYIKEIKTKIEGELNKICSDIQSVIDKYLLPNAKESEPKVFFLKLQGDYYRYKSEYAIGNEFEEACDKAEAAYKQATEIAEKDIPISNSTRLGLALNFSVFYYEIKNQKEAACNLAKTAFDKAMKVLDELEKVKAKDTLLIIQLLKENLILWDGEMNEEEH